MDNAILELICTTDVLLDEIARKETRQRDVILTYYMALCSSWPTDWRKVNRSIIERWSRSGLERIKKTAHKMIEATASHAPGGRDDGLIQVCDKCLQASCWQGIFMCDDAQNAGTIYKTRDELRSLKNQYGDEWENPSYWKTDEELVNG